MKLYLIPKGENGLPLHPTANVDECMKSFDKLIGEFFTEEDLRKTWNAAYIDALSIDEENYQPLFFEDFIKKLKQNHENIQR